MASSSRRQRALLAFLGVAAVGLAAPRARAQESVVVRDLDPKTGAAVKVEEKALTYLSLGPIFSFVDGGSSSEATWALGLEASLDHYSVERIFSFGYGAFAQAQLVTGNDFRCALGGQATLGPAGIELGLGYRQNDAVNASTLSLQASFFLSAGYLYIAFRASPQIAAFGGGGGEPGFGLETALTVGIKVPIAIQGRDPTGYAIQANGHAW